MRCMTIISYKKLFIDITHVIEGFCRAQLLTRRPFYIRKITVILEITFIVVMIILKQYQI